MIFDEDKVWDRKSITYSDDDIRILDKANVYIEKPESESKRMEDIQFDKNTEIDKAALIVTRQADHKDEKLNENLEESK